jgi:hypothetical protein
MTALKAPILRRTLLVAALAATLITVPAAAENVAFDRSHSTVVLSGRGIALSRFQASTRRASHGRIAIKLAIVGRALATPQHFLLQAYSCVKDAQPPTCPPVLTSRVAFTKTHTTTLDTTLRVPVPKSAVDAVLVRLALPERQLNHLVAAEILLPGRAWRHFPGRVFGVTADRTATAPIVLTTLRADASAIKDVDRNPVTMGAILQWAATGPASTPVTSTLTECPTCALRRMTGTLSAARAFEFRLNRTGTPLIWSYGLTAAGRRVFDVHMPWVGG